MLFVTSGTNGIQARCGPRRRQVGYPVAIAPNALVTTLYVMGCCFEGGEAGDIAERSYSEVVTRLLDGDGVSTVFQPIGVLAVFCETVERPISGVLDAIPAACHHI
jgi:hypothetical protein